MNAERLLALYEKVAQAPDAIAHLRQFVLDLTVRGKLVEQGPNDESASQLLKRIAVQKARLVKAGEIRKPRALPPSAPEHRPFTVPKSWKWARVDELSPRSLSDGDWIETKDQSEDGGIRLIQLADIGVGTFLDKSSRFITAETEIRLNCTRLAVGDVLIARLPNPIGRACIFPDIGQPGITAVDVAILRIDENVSAEYVVNAMNAPSTRNQIEAYGKGATRFRVSTGHLKTVLIPLPPLAEQLRIVAKVEELMALLDRLEAARTAREATRDRLTAASLNRLTTPDTTPEVFPIHARFALDALPALTSRTDQIKSLRQTILNLAVRGKLVEQDPNDEPAVEHLLGLGEVAAKVRKQLKPLNSSDCGGGLPRSWVWLPLGAIIRGMDAGWSPQCENHPRTNKDEWGVLKTTAVQALAFDPMQHKLLPAKLKPRPEFQAEVGDILVTRAGPKSRVGVSCVVDAPCPRLMISDKLIRFHALGELSPRYIALTLNAGFTFEQIEAAKSGMAVMQMNISQAKLRAIPIPLPSIAEQRRIVAQVDELMVLCDRLEAALATTDTTKQRLLEALLHEALDPTLKEAA